MEERKILLVEDNPDDIELVKLALKAKNIVNSIDIVTDGEEALDYLFARNSYAYRENVANPVLILLDLQLPKISGHEVLRQIRNHENTRNIPVVIFSSSKQAAEIEESYDLGANSYIQKPVDAGQFEQAVQKLQMYWLLLNEPPQ